MSPALHRRRFLRTVGVSAGALAAAPLLAACGADATDTAGQDTPGEDSGGAGPGTPAGEPTLLVHQATFEVLTGRDRYLAMGITDRDNTDLGDVDVEVLVRTVASGTGQEPEVLAGPMPATYAPADDTGIGVFSIRVDLPEAGFAEVVATRGDDFGTAVFTVVEPEDSQIVVPGEPAISAPTPTTEDDLGYFAVCTQDPPCGMHEVSLDEALASGRPVALLFATPAFCQTVVCGPSVETLDAVRRSGDWGDTVFIHSEIYAETPSGGDPSGLVFTEAVNRWALPTEPWLFTVDGDGKVVDRLDGPMPTPIVTELLTDLTGA